MPLAHGMEGAGRLWSRARLEGAAEGRDDVRLGFGGRDRWGGWVRVVRWGGAAVLGAAVLCFVVMSWRWRVVSDAALMHYVVFLQEQGWAPYRAVHDINLPGAWLPEWVAMGVGARAGLGGDLAWRLYDFGLLGVAAAAMVGMTWRQDWFAGVFAGGLLALFHGRDGMGQAGQRDLALAVLFLLAAWAFVEGMLGAERVRGERGVRGAEALGNGRGWLGANWTRGVRGAEWVRGGRGGGIESAGERGGEGRSLASLGGGGWGWASPGGLGMLFGLLGVAAGAAATVKPFGASLFLLLVGWAMVRLRGERWLAWRVGAAAVAGFALPVLAMVVFLLRQGAWSAFVRMCRVDLPYHAGAARPPFLGMVAGAFHPSIIKLAALPLVILLLRRSWRGWETRILLVGFGFGLFCYFAQHKGYGYQRYPYLAFLLLWVGRECAAALRAESRLLRALGVGGVLVGLGFCVPSYLRSIERARWPEGYLEAMEGDLRREGGAGLDGQVQCVDSISGCVTVLYRMRLQQATGMMYDEFLFPSQPEGALPAAVEGARREFLGEIEARRPRVFVVASWLFPEGPGNYGKLEEWGEFRAYLEESYRLVDEQAFPRSENGPLGFRMYVRR